MIYNKIKNYFLEYTRDEILCISVVLSMFLPFYFGCIWMILVCGFLFVNGKLPTIIKHRENTKSLLGFLLLCSLACIYFQNYLGLLCMLVISSLMFFILFYQNISHVKLTNTILNIMIFMSILCFIYTCLEYYDIVESLNYSVFELTVEDNPMYRVNSTFFNANYYAMMCEFFILVCTYKWLKTKNIKHRYAYKIACFFNFAGLYLTGSRAAWLTIAIALLALVYFMGYKKIALYLLGIEIVLAFMVMLNPELMPRLGDSDSSFSTRVDIWRTAILQIKSDPLFGHGPLTYLQVFPKFNGVATQHAHNIYLDMIMNFGLIPLFVLVPFAKSQFHGICAMHKSKGGKQLIAFIVSLTLVVLIHGMIDSTIFWSQTAFVYFLLISSSSLQYDEN